MDFDFLSKYSNNLSINSFKSHFKNVWDTRKGIFIDDFVRYLTENRKRASTYWNNGDEMFNGKSTELRLGSIFQLEGFHPRSTILGNIHPDKKELPRILKNKYVDIIIDDKILEIKTLSHLYFKSEGLIQNIVQNSIRHINSIRNKDYENISDYCIINASLCWYFPKEKNEENESYYDLYFLKTTSMKERKWLCTNNQFDSLSQDLFVYDLNKRKIVYINQDSFLFKGINCKDYCDDKKILSFDIPSRDEKKVLIGFSKIKDI